MPVLVEDSAVGNDRQGVLMPLAYLPSPDQGVWHLGPLPIRAYAIAILLGVVAAVLIGERRYVARGGSRGTVVDVATVAVPAGIVGARLYHVITTPALYFGPDGSLWRVVAVWEGGLGIWGGIAGGALAAAVVLRRHGLRAAPFADAVAPGIAVAQAIGRFGNYFNQELFGRPTTLPWGLRIDADNPDAVPGAIAYHPTFLYESLWNLGVAALLVWADRRWQLGGGRVFAVYVAAYTAGRAWIEACASTTPSSFSGSGSTSGRAWCCSSWPSRSLSLGEVTGARTSG
jgi:prolipoprotein diacylglyceryl transferase